MEKPGRSPNLKHKWKQQIERNADSKSRLSKARVKTAAG
jgi:hypothetical protein